jgi:hypothetical protein
MNLIQASPAIFTGALIVVFIWFTKKVIDRAWSGTPRMPADVQRALEEEAQRVVLQSVQKCPCGEIATESMPQLKRSRGAGDFLREWFAMPPRYRRVVTRDAPIVVCRSHAHVADAMLDHFIHSQVRSAFSRAHAEVAVAAASFEQERLLGQIGESLTEEQKRASKKLGPQTVLKVLPKTGTGMDES